MQKNKAIALLVLLMAGCTPEFHTPEMNTPEAWKNLSHSAEVARLSEAEWWKQFGSEDLSALIAKATAENNDLLAAAARVEQAKAIAKIAGSNLWPSLSAEADAGRDFNNRATVAGTSSISSYRAGADVAYEIDIFGKLRDAARSADASAMASAYDRDALRLTITAQVAESYFALLALNQRVAIAQSNVKNAHDILAVTQTRFDAGVLSQLELSQQKNLVANEEAVLSSLKQQHEAAQNLLAVLVGEPPESFATQDADLDALTPPEIASVLPAELMTRRPDIASLEAELRAANFDIGAARAAFFPSLDVSAGIALAASPASAAASTLSTLAAALTVPLFTGGALEGGLENATARQKELAADYRKAVLTAFGETENTLYGLETTQDRLGSLIQAADEAKKAYDTSMTRFNAGAIDYLTLLTTQNSLFQAQDTLAQAKADRLAASVDLFKAVGGGWNKP